MRIKISNLSIWYPNSQANASIEELAKNSDEHCKWPEIDFIPPMQRRRLSPFAKMALFVANRCVKDSDGKMAVVFSSRHGDLFNTSKLIEDIALQQSLSPTSFGLSVHNAIPGLYSVFTKNNKAINAISAGKDTFIMAIVDAYARLKSGLCDKILIIHADQVLPEQYLEFQDEQQISHAIAMVVSLPNKAINDEYVTLHAEHQPQQAKTELENALPLALTFAKWYASSNRELCCFGLNNRYKLTKHV